MTKVKVVVPDSDKKGFTVLDKCPVDEHKNRELPNSDPAGDDSMSYQDQPWQKKSDW